MTEIQKLIGKTNQLKKHSGKSKEICSICGEAKLIQDGIYELHVDCKCDRDERTKLRLKRFTNLSITTRENGDNTFENAVCRNRQDEDMFSKFVSYTSKFKKAKEENVGILISGNVGTGKTFYVNCIANGVQSQGNTVLSFNLSGYLRKIQDQFIGSGVNEEERLLMAVREVDLLIIDDLGSEKLTEWGIEKVYNLIDERYRAKKPILITTNLNSKSELDNHLDMNGSNKIVDRITAMTHPIRLTGESRRKKPQSDIFG